MKKIVVSLIMLMSILSVKAQSFNEIDLIGKWNVSSVTGNHPLGIKSFTGIYFGYATVSDDENETHCSSGFITDFISYDYYRNCDYSRSYVFILDFFISNNNKLHIIIGDDYGLRFIIESLSDTSMKLKSYDGATTIELTKESSTGIKEFHNSPNAESGIYNIEGKSVGTTTSDGIYIINGKKVLIRK